MIFFVHLYDVTPNLTEDENFLYKNWFDKGVRNVVDLIDMNGNIYSFHQLKEVYGIKGTFLDYQTLIRKIPRSGKEKKQLLKIQMNVRMLSIMYVLIVILKDKKRSRSVYD